MWNFFVKLGESVSPFVILYLSATVVCVCVVGAHYQTDWYFVVCWCLKTKSLSSVNKECFRFWHCHVYPSRHCVVTSSSNQLWSDGLYSFFQILMFRVCCCCFKLLAQALPLFNGVSYCEIIGRKRKVLNVLSFKTRRWATVRLTSAR